MYLFLILLSTITAVRAQDCIQSNSLRQIRPSTVDSSFNPNPPNITVGETTYSSDAHHFIMPPSKTSDSPNSNILKVFLPGTSTAPQDMSCLLSSIGSPSIGLSYLFLDSADATRNHACAERHGLGQIYLNCLANQHVDALWGGQSEPGGLWQYVERRDSIEGRLTLLLHYLNQEYPQEGWDTFLQVIPGLGSHMRPMWDRIWIMGHSQGAGHAAFLAQSMPLAGAGLLSGPQDDCSDSGNCWIADHWETRDVRVLAHAHEDATELIVENWKLMDVFEDSSTPIQNVDAISSPAAGEPWLTSFEPQPSAKEARRANHTSLALDSSSPVNEESGVYLYSTYVWPELAGIYAQCQTS